MRNEKEKLFLVGYWGCAFYAIWTELIDLSCFSCQNCLFNRYLFHTFVITYFRAKEVVF